MSLWKNRKKKEKEKEKKNRINFFACLETWAWSEGVAKAFKAWCPKPLLVGSHRSSACYMGELVKFSKWKELWIRGAFLAYQEMVNFAKLKERLRLGGDDSYPYYTRKLITLTLSF